MSIIFIRPLTEWGLLWFHDVLFLLFLFLVLVQSQKSQHLFGDFIDCYVPNIRPCHWRLTLTCDLYLDLLYITKIKRQLNRQVCHTLTLTFDPDLWTWPLTLTFNLSDFCVQKFLAGLVYFYMGFHYNFWHRLNFLALEVLLCKWKSKVLTFLFQNFCKLRSATKEHANFSNLFLCYFSEYLKQKRN